MRKALTQAQAAFEVDEVPVGAVVEFEGRIIAAAHNQCVALKDGTAHAEMLAITQAAEMMGDWRLERCTMYVTLEPCVMCAGALSWAQLGRLVFGASDDKKGFFRYGKELLHPKTVVLQGVMEAQCSGLVKEFFKNKR